MIFSQGNVRSHISFPRPRGSLSAIKARVIDMYSKSVRGSAKNSSFRELTFVLSFLLELYTDSSSLNFVLDHYVLCV